MGDITEGILNGDFDELTGEYIGPGHGFPRTLERNRRPQPPSPRPPKTRCPHCGKTTRGLADHLLAKHPPSPTPVER